MKSQTPLLDRTATLLAETMGDETGRLFYKFYEFDDDDQIITGARSLLIDFIGPKMTEQKIKTLSGKR